MMKKLLICLSLILLGLSVFPVTVKAENYDPEGDYNFDDEFDVVFTQDHKIVYYIYVTVDGVKTRVLAEEADLSLNLSNVQPGDSLRRIYHLKNESSETIDWYLSNTSKAFEDLEVAKNASYEYQLYYDAYQYTDDEGTVHQDPVIYSNTVVGGMKTQNRDDVAPEGIKEATYGLEGFFLIHEGFTPSDSEDLELTLVIDGLSSELVYQDAEADVAVQFGVVIPPKSTERHEERIVYIPYTGDTLNVNFYLIAELLSLILLAVILFAYYRYLKKQREA
ncbi:MAG: hypothetical protein IJI77_05725 [Erysipelotrichaceae bacterium]|nr:hypothetical protein [Erysipelotrichaceae bacterium]